MLCNRRRSQSSIYNNLQGSRLRGRPRTDDGTVYKQILIDAHLKTGKKGQKRTERTGRSPLRRRRSVLDCSFIKEEVEKEEKKKKEEEVKIHKKTSC